MLVSCTHAHVPPSAPPLRRYAARTQTAEDRGTTKLGLGYCSTLAWADGIDAESQLLIQKMMAEDTMSGPAGRYSLRVKKGKKDGSEEKEDDAVRV